MNPAQEPVDDASTYSLSLRDIAAWNPDAQLPDRPRIRATVPALQRGLVWKPPQLELLWDSLLRGFPVGAFVICQIIRSQVRTKGNPEANFHLLDGQQRFNAIALGFTDPFPELSGTPPDAKEIASILWLDLKPTHDRNSTRNFLVRITTTAHPWGYTRGDDDGPMSAGKIRSALATIGLDPKADNYKRPSPVRLYPFDADVPIPLAWLLLAAADEENSFWQEITERAAKADQPWAKKLQAFLREDGKDAVEHRHAVFAGIIRARKARIIALVAPPELLEESQQEKAVEGPEEAISNVEHLFQRLNQQGTRLDDEELAYSMIKAYWPELADPIDRIARRRMPESRMVSLGVQGALARKEADRLPTRRGVSEIRAIARKDDGRKSQISRYIEHHLEANCELVERWLLFRPGENASGLLPVHLTSLARSSRDVYLLLLCFADRLRRAGAGEADHEWRVPMQALATVLHWFGADSAKAANRVYKQCREEINLPNIKTALKEAIKAKELHPIQSPRTLAAFVPVPHKLGDWRWEHLFHAGKGSPEEAERLQEKWSGTLQIRWNREMLLYAQRGFLHQRFTDYDPARRDLWEDHNRPWDFDHLLASSFLYNRKNGDYGTVARQWYWTIGNLRAWPFEDNRSDQAEIARKKISNDAEYLEKSFLLKGEPEVFSGGDEVRLNPAAARQFIKACRRRLLRIYRHWYESMRIADLLRAD